MKARVKTTGEIVEINESSTIYDARMCHVYNVSELENVPDTDLDYWTRLENQAAIAAMQGILSNQEYVHSLVQRVGGGEIPNLAEGITKYAEQFAHALVEKLKEKEERK